MLGYVSCGGTVRVVVAETPCNVVRFMILSQGKLMEVSVA